MARARSQDPVQQYRYSVSISGVSGIGFNNVDGLEESYEVAEYAEGGYETNHKLPGKLTTETVTLERGASDDMQLANWFRSILTEEDVRRRVTIVERDFEGSEVRRHTLVNAWASTFTRPTYDAESSEVAIDTIELEHEGIITE